MSDLSAAERKAMEQAQVEHVAGPAIETPLAVHMWLAARDYYWIKPDPEPRQPALEMDDELGP